MPILKPEIAGVNVTMIGSFNPLIFQPAWFGAHELIRMEEAETAEVQIVHSDVVDFRLKNLFSVQVTHERFHAATTQSQNYEVFRDFVVATFRLLKHTPVSKIGINREQHFRMPSETEWHAFGDQIAPKGRWNEILKEPGMRKLTMEGKRSDDYKGIIQVRVEPSVRVQPGVFIHINDHYEVRDEKSSQGCTEVLEILETNWQKSIERSEKIAVSLMERK